MQRLYRLLLVLYPPVFRHRYGMDMMHAFASREAAARKASIVRRMAFYLSALRDLVVNAIGERIGRAGPGPRVRHDDASRALACWIQDARFAVRIVRREPALSAFSAATLAAGIGAVTAVAGLVDAVLLAPLPYPRPAEIVVLRGTFEGRPARVSYENLRDIAAQVRGLHGVSPFFAQSVNLTGVPEPDRLRGGFVTSGFFSTVGVPPALGRAFDSDSDIPGSTPVAVLTHETWQQRFDARGDIVGRQLQLNNTPFTVVGVMPEGFRFPIDYVEVFLPFWTTTAGTSRDNHNYFGIARLQSAVTITQGAAEAAAAAETLERTYPDLNHGRRLTLEPLKDALIRDVEYPLTLLALMAAVMLAAACANVAGLQLGSLASRRREIALRAALGAGRARIARQAIFDSLARATVGAGLGVTAAHAAIRYVRAHAPSDIYGLENAGLSGAALAVAGGATLLAGLAAGLLPAVQWTRHADLSQLGAGGRTAGDGPTSALRRGLVVCQVALAAILLVATGLVTRSFATLTSVATGFDASRVLTLEYRLPRNRYSTPAAQSAFHDAVIDRVRGLRGVIDAAAVRALPFSGNGSTFTFATTPDGARNRAAFNAVSERYFDVLHIPVLSGRIVRPANQNAVVAVSRSLAERHWPGRAAVGRTLYFDGVNIVATVIAVVGDVRHRDLTDEETEAIYTFVNQNPSAFTTLVVRTSLPPMMIASDVRRAVWTVDPDQPVWKVRALDALVDQSVAPRRFVLQLVLFFGLSVAALSLLGLYAVVSSTVARRTREIGVRVALGATPANVLRLVLAGGIRLALSGIAIGMLGALLAAKLLESLLFGIGARDPLTFAASAVLLLGAAFLACWIPSRRAIRVDPVLALRD